MAQYVFPNDPEVTESSWRFGKPQESEPDVPVLVHMVQKEKTEMID